MIIKEVYKFQYVLNVSVRFCVQRPNSNVNFACEVLGRKACGAVSPNGAHIFRHGTYLTSASPLGGRRKQAKPKCQLEVDDATRACESLKKSCVSKHSDHTARYRSRASTEPKIEASLGRHGAILSLLRLLAAAITQARTEAAKALNQICRLL